MELINIRFFKPKGGLTAQQGSGTRVRRLLQVTGVLTTPSLTVDSGAASGRKRNYVMNEQYRSCFVRSGWLDWIHTVSWVLRNFTKYRTLRISQ